METKAGKGEHCNPVTGNGTRQWHLHVAIRPPASCSYEQTRTRVANTHNARVPKLHNGTAYREGGGVPLQMRPPRALGNIQLVLWRVQPVGTPGRITSNRRHILANTTPCANSALAPGAAPTSTHIRRNMLANRVSHGNPALVRKQRIATTNSSHTTVSSTYGAHVHKAWRWPPSASSHKLTLSTTDASGDVVAPSGAYICRRLGVTPF